MLTMPLMTIAIEPEELDECKFFDLNGKHNHDGKE